MKLTKLASLALLATVALEACSAKAAIIGITTNYSKLTCSFTITTNAADVYNAATSTYTYKTKSAKYGNKQLLGLMSTWSTNAFPAGVMLVVGWESQWDGDVLVIDKSGNVYWDASSGPAYFYVTFNEDDGAYSETYVDKDPGSDKWKQTYTGYFQLFDDTYIPYTYIWGYGGNSQSFSQAWDANGNYTKWSDSESFTIPFNGHQYLLDQSYGTTSGKITASGSGKGNNYYWY